MPRSGVCLLLGFAFLGDGPEQRRPSKKKRLNDIPPKAMELRQQIITAAKTQDPALAIQAYDESVGLGILSSND